MAHDFRLEFLKYARYVFVADVHVDEACALRDVCTRTAAVLPQRIDHQNLVPRGEVRIDDVRPNEAGPAGNSNSQDVIPFALVNRARARR